MSNGLTTGLVKPAGGPGSVVGATSGGSYGLTK